MSGYQCIGYMTVALLTTSLSAGIFLSTPTPLYGNQCSYQAQIDQCAAANADGSTRTLDFFCPENHNEEFQVYQVVLDQSFDAFDTEIEEYLTQLEEQKNKFYSGNLNYFDGYDEIADKFAPYGEYWQKYALLCRSAAPGSIIQQSLACLPDATTTHDGLLDFFQESACMDMVELKLSIYRDIADDILYKNKTHIVLDAQKTYGSESRERYSELTDAMSYNIGLIYRLVKKYPNRNQVGNR